MIEKTSKKLERTIQNSKILYLGCFLFLLLGLFTAKSVSAIANQISFQGKLTDSSGSLVTDGTYYLKFSIYDSSSGGTCQYTAAGSCGSATTTPVTLTSGIFSVNLGDTDNGINALASNLFNADALYLGITVCSGPNTGCDAEMTPRKRITAAPYAFNADRLSGLTTSTQGGDSSYVPVTDSSGDLRLSNSLFLATSTAGQLGIGTSTVPTGYKAYLESTTAADKLLVIRANASQTGNLTEWQNSSGVSLLSIDPTGGISTSGTLSIFGDLNRINNVAYTWPSSQGGANTYLKNDGSGGLTWATVTGGSSINDWGRFGETYGVSALMTSTSYPVWFDNAVVASSTVLIAGNEAYLDIGGLGNGLSQLFVQASSSEAVPLVIRGPAGGTGNTDDLFFAIQNSSGNNILSFSTSTYGDKQSNGAALTIGGNGHPGWILLNGDGTDSPGIIAFMNAENTYVQGMYSHSGWTGSDDYGNSTSSLSLNGDDAGLYLFQQSGYDSGTFNVNSTGNISTSGTLSIFGNLNRINNVAYTWPSSQGGSNTYLKNDGSGGLTWATVTGGSSINDWGRFGETYGVSALMTSSSYPVWFDNSVYASSSVLIAGAEAHLDIGAPGNGLSQLFVQASSSEAVPLVIRGADSQTGNLQEWRNPSGSVLARMSSWGSLVMSDNGTYLSSGSLNLGDGQGITFLTNTGNFSTGASVPGVDGFFSFKIGAAEDTVGSNTIWSIMSYDIGLSANENLVRFNYDGEMFLSNTSTNKDNIILSGLTGNLSTSGTLSIFGDLNRINNVAYTWPSSQGGANTYLKNDGSGGLTWATVAGGSSINDWGRFGETYGVSALMTSTSYPVWFDNIVAASSSVLIAGAEAHLDIGAPGNGLSQLFVQASSSEAVPLVIRGPAGGTGNTDDLFFAIQNSSGNNILSFSTSTGSIVFPIGHTFDLEQSAVLSIGDVNHLGGVIVNSGFLVNDYNNSYVGSLFSADRWMVSSGGVSTSSLFAGESENDAGLILFAQDNYDSGTFHIDPSGDISTSGTLAVYGGEILVQSAESTDNPLVIRSNSTQTGNLTEWQDSLGNKLGGVASTTVAIDGFSESGLILSLGNNYEESDPSFFHGGLAIDGDNFYDANTFIIHDTIFLTADAGNSSIFNSHYLSLGKVSSTSGDNGLIYLDGDDGYISASNTIQNFVVSGGGSDDYWQKWLDSSGSVRASLTSSTGSYIAPNTNNVSFSEASLLVLGAPQHAGVLYLTDDGSVLLGDRGIVTGELKRSKLFLSDPFDAEVTATTTYGYKEIVFVQDENYDQGYFHMDDSGNISTSGSIRLFGDLGSPSYNTGLSLFSVSDDGSVVTNTLQSFVGDAAGSTGFAFDTVASGGDMTSGTTDRMLAVFQNNGTNKVSISAGGNVYAANSFIANSTDYGIGDVAEYVNLANGASAEAGDVLVVDTTGSNVYKKSDSAYAKNVAGVVSDTGKFVMGASGLNRAPLALAGLVKVKATNENGAINPGDYLITASKSGYAMKYDPANSLSAAGLVGMALESLIDTEGKITILVNKGLVAGASNNVTMSVDGSGQLISNNNLDLAGSGIINVGSIVAASGLWQIDSEGKIIAKSITADKIQTKELVLAKDQTQESTIGEATILSGQQNVEVLNTKIKKNSKIFVTFRGNPGSFWWIGNQEDGKFSVFLSSNAAQDITFDYWLVTIDEEDTATSVGTEVVPGANNSNPFTNLPPIGSTSSGDSSNSNGSTENSESNSTETAGNFTSGESDTTTNTNGATDESSSAATNNENSSSAPGNTEVGADNSTNSETADNTTSSETTTETAS